MTLKDYAHLTFDQIDLSSLKTDNFLSALELCDPGNSSY